jgi:hypothetical protein
MSIIPLLVAASTMGDQQAVDADMFDKRRIAGSALEVRLSDAPNAAPA